MPNYDVECGLCGVYERIRSVDHRHDPCDRCGQPIAILITSSTKSKGFEPMFDIGLGETVTGIGHRKQLMRAENLDYKDHPSKGDQSARLDKINEAKRREQASR